MDRKKRTRACVVVMGDIGRSPRMRFHALSLASHGAQVDLVGYPGSRIHPQVSENPNIRLVFITEPPHFVEKLPKILLYGFKILWALATLVFTLIFRTCWFDIVLLQNPPGVPALFVCWLVARLKWAKFMIDWHNYTYSILEYQYGRKSKFVRVAEWLEARLGKRADASLCVTHGMRTDLNDRWGVRAVTLYDRPNSGYFRSISVAEKHSFFLKMAKEKNYEVFWSNADSEPPEIQGQAEVTAFSYRRGGKGGKPKLRATRPAILVSGTSWTPDEDFSILLGALERYDSIAVAREDEKSARLPEVVAIITGKGPLKGHYMEEIRKKSLRKVQFLTPWLEAEDYPTMLACSDIGVSLHTSTSGLDLPMKVVDMFGVGLPVVAKKFPCIDELVKEGENGRLFESESQLANLLVELLRGFPFTPAYSSDFSDLIPNSPGGTRRAPSSPTNSTDGDLKSENNVKGGNQSKISPGNSNEQQVRTGPTFRLEVMKQNLRDLPLVPWEDNWDAIMWPLICELTAR